MRLDGERVYIRRLEGTDAEALLELRVRNRAFFQPYEPVMPEEHFTVEAQRGFIEGANQFWESRSGYQFGIFLQESNELIGRVNFVGAMWGPFQSINLGYSLAEAYNGKGLTTEAVRLGLRYIFEETGLHRVQAVVMPRNIGSVRVLEKAGFRREGLCERYLKIHDVWEDHLLYAITSEEWESHV